MKIVVDYDRCESNGVCMSIVPEVFEVRDDDFMYVLDERPPETLHARVRQAVDACPTQALSFVDEGAGKPVAAKVGGNPDQATKPSEGMPASGEGSVDAAQVSAHGAAPLTDSAGHGEPGAQKPGGA